MYVNGIVNESHLAEVCVIIHLYDRDISCEGSLEHTRGLVN